MKTEQWLPPVELCLQLREWGMDQTIKPGEHFYYYYPRNQKISDRSQLSICDDHLSIANHRLKIPTLGDLLAFVREKAEEKWGGEIDWDNFDPKKDRGLIQIDCITDVGGSCRASIMYFDGEFKNIFAGRSAKHSFPTLEAALVELAKKIMEEVK